jgi:hypothetical protein
MDLSSYEIVKQKLGQEEIDPDPRTPMRGEKGKEFPTEERSDLTPST